MENIEFKGNLVPSPKLLEGEKEQMRIKAGLMELGLLGFIFRQKEQIVLTTKRVFQFSSRIGSAYLRTMPLKQVESITIGGQLNFIMLGIAGLFVLGTLPDDVEFGGKLFFLLVAAALIVLSRRKVIIVSSGDRKDAIVLPLQTIKKSQSQEFLDKISENINNQQ